MAAAAAHRRSDRRGGRHLSRGGVPGGAGRSSAGRIVARPRRCEPGRRALRPVIAAAPLGYPPCGSRSGSPSISRTAERGDAPSGTRSSRPVFEHKFASNRRVERRRHAAVDGRHSGRGRRAASGRRSAVCKRDQSTAQGRCGRLQRSVRRDSAGRFGRRSIHQHASRLACRATARHRRTDRRGAQPARRRRCADRRRQS